MLRQISIAFFFLISAITANAQDLNWIPFKWNGDSAGGKYFDKFSINIPVKVDNLPANFNMQFDLGAVTTVIYGKSIKPYLDKYPGLKKQN